MRCVVLAATLAAMTGISFGASAQPLTIDANGQARVPQGVYWLDVQVASAGGGGGGSDDGGDGSIGGAGVLITGTISVVPNQVISVVQGKGGSNGGTSKRIRRATSRVALGVRRCQERPAPAVWVAVPIRTAIAAQAGAEAAPA